MPTPAKARHKGKTTKLRAWRALAAMKQFSIENIHAAANGGTLCSCVSIFKNLSPLTMVGRKQATLQPTMLPPVGEWLVDNQIAKKTGANRSKARLRDKLCSQKRRLVMPILLIEAAFYPHRTVIALRACTPAPSASTISHLLGNPSGREMSKIPVLWLVNPLK